MEAIADVILAIASVAWPILVWLVFRKAWPTVRDTIQSRSFVVRVGGAEISVQQSTDQLRTIVEDLQRRVEELRAPVHPEQAPTEPPTMAAGRLLAWVDDVPENNAFEIARLREEGIEVLELTSTEDAVRTLVKEGRSVDVVVSDMGRHEGGVFRADAGLVLIQALRSGDVTAPIYIYTTSESARETRAKVQKRGGNDTTNSYVELFEFFRQAGLLRR